MKRLFFATVLTISLLSCASTREFTVQVVNYQGEQIRDTTVIVRPYGLFCLKNRVKGVQYRFRLSNAIPLVIAPVATAGWYLMEPKPQQNFVIKQ